MYRALLASPIAQRNLILALLLGVAAACWALLLAAGDAGMAMASPTMGLAPAAFMAIWVIMMIAMMFPTAAPMILTFHRIEAGKRERGDPFVSAWLFVAGYMVVWTLAGGVAYLMALAAEAVAAQAGLPASVAARFGGALLVAAGLYQLSPLKNLCLSKCRSPLSFILTSWRDGAAGALRMGIEHGLYCLGCCWLLFVVLFPLGIMNIAAMVLVTLIVFAEKSLAWERGAVYATSAVLIVYGGIVLAMPRALPTYAASEAPMPGMNMPGMTMPGTPAPPVKQ